VFENIATSYRSWLATQQFTIADLQVIPISALCGDNVVERSESMSWYSGPTLLDYLETVPTQSDYNLDSFRFAVQYVQRPNQNFRGFSGKISSGIIRVGDSVTALPSGKQSTVKSIVTYDGDLEYAFAPQSVTITLSDEIDLSRGDMLVLSDQPRPQIGHNLTAMMVWMDEQPLVSSKHFYLKHTTNTVRAKVSEIYYRVDINTAEHIPANTLSLNEIAKVCITTAEPIFCDPYTENRQTGAFIVIDPITNFTSAVGMVIELSDNGCLKKEVVNISLKQLGIDISHSEAIALLCKELERRCGITINCTE
jgi:sulfate adenylyltransferase subunit 1